MTQKDDSDIDDPIPEDNPTPVNGKRKRTAPLKNCPLLDQQLTVTPMIMITWISSKTQNQKEVEVEDEDRTIEDVVPSLRFLEEMLHFEQNKIGLGS